MSGLRSKAGRDTLAHKRETLHVVDDVQGSRDIGEDSTLLAPEDTMDVSVVPIPRFDGLADKDERRQVEQALFGGSSPSFKLGRYVITGTLGRGGMGVVFKAFDPELDRTVALKVLHTELDERQAIRLRREAQAMAKLSHPNVVQVHEIGQAEGQTFVAMELVGGQTLRAWMHRDPRPTWRQCVEVFAQVGMGLAAAHERGLVHRDFKPGNAIVDAKGRARVLDFGLARQAGDAEEDPPSIQKARTEEQQVVPLDVSLTKTGAVLGTPAYMPPEQMEGREADARSDQFSFCVALYEAVYGQRPFEGGSMHALMLSMMSGAVRPAPADGKAPGTLYAALLRGLAYEPSARWSSMEALLQALEAVARRQRRRRQVAALGLSLATTASVAGFAGATWLPNSGPTVADCEVGAEQIDAIWDEERRRAIRRNLDAHAPALARETWSRVDSRVGDWTSRWKAEQRSSCRATWVEGTQSEAMLDRRTACLRRQRGEVDAQLDVFTASDADVVARSVLVLAELPDLGACSVEALDGDGAPNIPVGMEEDIEAGYEALARARAQLVVGHPQDSRAFADQARAYGQSTEYLPLTLEARVALADIEIDGGALDRGLELLREVVLDAERAQLLELAATLRVSLARKAAGDFAEPRLERWLIDEAQLAVDRIGRPLDPREVTLESARARIAEQGGDFSAAIAAHERAYALAEGRLGEADRAMLRMGVGTALYRNGDYESARAELLSVRETARTAWGPRTPEVARIEFDLGLIETDLGNLPQAQQHLDSALAIDEAVWGRDSVRVARERFAMAQLAFRLGELDRGCAMIEPVLVVFEAGLGPTHDETALALNTRAMCFHNAGNLPDALEGYQRALTIQRQTLGEDHPDVGLLYTNLGLAQLFAGQLDASLASQERACEIFSGALPEDHPDQADPLTGRALVLVEAGRAAEAIADLERALSLTLTPSTLAEARFGLARALIAVHGPRERRRAIELGRKALEWFERARVDNRIRAVRTWLEAHRK